MTWTQTNILTLIEEGQRLREEGIQRATDHADKVHEAWTQRAFNVAVEYLNDQPHIHRFQVEDVRFWAYNRNKIEKPPSERAWTTIVTSLKKAGRIRQARYATTISPKAHGAISTLWEKM